MNDPPIACALDADALSRRRTSFGDLARDAVLERVAVSDGMIVRLRNAPGVERRTRALIAAEQRCCPFLSFDLRDAGDALVLRITGPELAQPIIRELFAAAAAS